MDCNPKTTFKELNNFGGEYDGNRRLIDANGLGHPSMHC